MTETNMDDSNGLILCSKPSLDNFPSNKMITCLSPDEVNLKILNNIKINPINIHSMEPSINSNSYWLAHLLLKGKDLKKECGTGSFEKSKIPKT